MLKTASNILVFVQTGLFSLLFFLCAIDAPAQQKNTINKLSPVAAEALHANRSIWQQYVVTAANTDSLLAYLAKWPQEAQVIFTDLPSRSALIKTTAAFIQNKLLPLSWILFADKRIAPHTEANIIGYNRSFHGLSAVDYLIPGANGKNITVGIKEQKMEAADLDLHKRVVASPLASSTVTNHATVISSIIGGAGNSFYDGRGIAYGSNFFSSSFANLFPDDVVPLNSNRVTVQNHSYGTVVQSFYGAEAVSYDEQTWANKNIVHVFSAGNQGNAVGSGVYAGINGFANITGNFKMAKNIITVGAIDNKNMIPAESSSGPLHDGRIAPQLIALGPNGTSDAAAVVTGTAAVMQQVYADSNSGQLPAASLIKAVLYNTADDVHRAGIDYKTGYGMLNSLQAIKAIQQRKYDGASIGQGQQWVKAINVPSGSASLKVTLAWTDSAAAINNSKALVNDIDLEVTELSTGVVYQPWVLSSSASADSLPKLPVRKRDSLNTAEQVSIAIPAAGVYQIKVSGTLVAHPPLAFHIAYSVDTLNTFSFTSPVHTSDINRDENPLADIRWRTFVADTNQTGNLHISYNGGTNWQVIKAAHKIYTNYYQWPVKDTASRAMFRMETSFGNFFSNEFVLGKVIRPVVDFVCTDTFSLSWNRHIYASSYKIYTLTDSPYLKPVRTVTDTFVVLSRSLYPGLVYAVEPVLSNNIPAARSIAFDITQQGVKCFYKTFYYVLQNENKLDLIVELSAPSYVDSVYYEQVTAGGMLLRTVGFSKTNTAAIYQQIVTDVPSGISYWRVKIKLKSGAIVYTEIVSVLTSGAKQILFYPSPVNRNAPVSWVIRQGTAASSRLQLFDGTGRLMADYKELPSSLNLKHFPAGLVFYKLLTNDGNFIEAGKLVLH